jgi:hypothetical protein
VEQKRMERKKKGEGTGRIRIRIRKEGGRGKGRDRMLREFIFRYATVERNLWKDANHTRRAHIAS